MLYSKPIFGNIDFLAYGSWQPFLILGFLQAKNMGICLVILDMILSYSTKFQLVTNFFQVGVLFLLPRLDYDFYLFQMILNKSTVMAITKKAKPFFLSKVQLYAKYLKAHWERTSI